MTQVSLDPEPTENRRAILDNLLDESLRFCPEYADGLANHLPMALAALDGLGADAARMRAFFARYASRLVPLSTAGDADLPSPPVGDWQALRGRVDAYARLRHYFDAALVLSGRDSVLRDALPALIDGAAAAAFHGPIRVAHAIESGHAGELAAALAYSAARWLPLPEPLPPGESLSDPAAWLEALDAHRSRSAPDWRATAPLISERMRQATLTLAWTELAGALKIADGDVVVTWRALAKAASARYAATRNFTMLHMATASRAAQVLAPWVTDRTTAWMPMLHAIAAASLVASAMPARRPPPNGLTWSDVRRAACASDDDHVIKLVHAMVMQHGLAPDAVWLEAARTAVSGDATTAGSLRP